jgi:polar amino acid transport system substrate-binding protein
MPAAIAEALAPTCRLRVAVWTVPYFAVEQAGILAGIIPDLGAELACRLGVPLELIRCATPGALIEAFRSDAADVTFVGITADRAEAMDFGPVVLDIATSYLVPQSSAITAIADVDRAGVRVLVPARSAQEAYLRKTMVHATLISVAPESPQDAIEMLASGAADALSHVAPMLASAQPRLSGSRILTGSYFNVPVAIGITKGQPRAAADYVRRFANDVTSSGFVQQAIDRAGVTGMVVAG